MRLSMTALLAAVTFAAAAVPARSAGTDLTSLAPLVGRWSCVRSASSTGVGLGSPSTTTWAIGVQGGWMTAVWTYPATATRPAAETRDFFTYDPDRKAWIVVIVDSGGGYTLGSGEGMQPDRTMTFREDADLAHGAPHWQHVLALRDATHFTVRSTGGTDPNGAPHFSETTCTKTS